MNDLKYEIVSVPVNEHLARAFAVIENDRDIAQGHAVDAATLDALEAFDRDLHCEVSRAIFFGTSA